MPVGFSGPEQARGKMGVVRSIREILGFEADGSPLGVGLSRKMVCGVDLDPWLRCLHDHLSTGSGIGQDRQFSS